MSMRRSFQLWLKSSNPMFTYNLNVPRSVDLSGKTVFLSASVPSIERNEQYRRIANAAVSIEEAVLAVTRAVFSAGGRLVFGAHPSISPLVASVIGEYIAPEVSSPENKNRSESKESERRANVFMYQSKAWAELWAERSKELAERPQVHLRWTDAAPGEKVDSKTLSKPQVPESMRKMRRQMISETSPAAMVAIGGMEGVEEEVKLFTELCPNKPVFVFSTTGGAAGIIAERHKDYKSHILVVDENSLDDVKKFWASRESHDSRSSDSQKIREGSAHADYRDCRYYVPYSVLAQQIVKKIAG